MIMEPDSLDTLTILRWPVYFIAAGLIISPLFDFVTSVLPLQLWDMHWRFATVALFSGFLLTPLLGVVLISLVAALVGDRIIQRVLAVLCLTATVVLLGLMVLYALDVIQIRHNLPAGDRLPFDMATLRASVHYFFLMLALLFLGIAGVRASRARKSQRASRHGDVAPLFSGSGQ